MTEEFLAPDYRRGALPSVLPAIAASLGVGVGPDPGWGLPPARRSIVVLVDGLGDALLRSRAGHAPFLRSLLAGARTLDAGFPTTTATSMGSFGVGLPPGSHGLVGYEVLDVGSGRLFNELSWEDGPTPERWQPHPTIFEGLVAGGVSVTRIGPAFFHGSGLTRAALRGGRFVAAASLAARVDAAIEAARQPGPSLSYLYWGDLDKVGHTHGAQSWQWGDELSAIDHELARLAASIAPDVSLYVTADHGMVDCPFEDRIDLAVEPELAQGLRFVGGEPRAPQLYCLPGAAAEVAAAWAQRLGSTAWVRAREDVVAAGWFGPVAPSVVDRIGDIVVVMRDRYAVVDSRRQRPEFLALLGHHGSLTLDERLVPLLTLAPRSDGRG